MRFIVQVGLFFLALLADVTRVLDIPVRGGVHPLMFLTIAVSFAVSSGAFAGGVWGFSGGLALGLLAGFPQIGALTLGGFLSGCIPVLLRPLVFWRRWTGQFVFGFAATVLFNLTLLAVAGLRGEASGVSWISSARMVVDSLLTAGMCPFICLWMAGLERRY